jgi:hypothetical protein
VHYAHYEAGNDLKEQPMGGTVEQSSARSFADLPETFTVFVLSNGAGTTIRRMGPTGARPIKRQQHDQLRHIPIYNP